MKGRFIAWSKLVVAKEEGGMGFRDFECFNLALLAKQAWRIVTNPNEFWVEILKGLYFPHTDFLFATKGSRASWGWSSILDGRRLLAKGLCWRVGSGRDVRIWDDAWIPSLPGFNLKHKPPDYDFPAVLVEDLIVDGRWSLDCIGPWITLEEKEAILRIPIPRYQRSDRLIWAYSKDGVYSVKSGYEEGLKLSVVSSVGAGSSELVPSELWKAIWKLKTPRKVKNFLWRACSSALPTKENLMKRRCAVNAWCPCCEEHPETVEHLLLFCDWVRRAWFSCSLTVRVDAVGFISFEKWCWKWLVDDSSLGDEEKSLIAIMCWEIWKERCSFVFQKQAANPILVGIRASNLHAEFWKCTTKHCPDSAEIAVKEQVHKQLWRFPSAGVIKFNFDGSFLNPNVSAGIGGVIRDCYGKVVNGFAAAINSVSPFATEAFACLKACDMATALALDFVVFETDCRSLYLAICDGVNSFDWKCEAIISDIRVSFSSNPNFSLRLISRHANMVADLVAKLAAKKMCPIGWVSTPPSSLAQVLSEDCLAVEKVDADRDGVG